jgi:hypothetical protein
MKRTILVWAVILTIFGVAWYADRNRALIPDFQTGPPTTCEELLERHESWERIDAPADEMYELEQEISEKDCVEGDAEGGGNQQER